MSVGSERDDGPVTELYHSSALPPFLAYLGRALMEMDRLIGINGPPKAFPAVRHLTADSGSARMGEVHPTRHHLRLIAGLSMAYQLRQIRPTSGYELDMSICYPTQPSSYGKYCKSG